MHEQKDKSLLKKYAFIYSYGLNIKDKICSGRHMSIKDATKI